MKHYSDGFPVPEGNANGHDYMGEDLMHKFHPERGRFALLCSECMEWTDGFNFKCNSPCNEAHGDMFSSKRYVCDPCKSVLHIRTPYAVYLKSVHWQRVRGEALERANGHCQLCFAQYGLEVHHNNYRNRGKERPSDVIVLCRKCHAHHHNKAVR